MKKIDLSRLGTDTETQLAWLVEHETLTASAEKSIETYVCSGEKQKVLILFNTLDLSTVVFLATVPVSDEVREKATKLNVRLNRLSDRVRKLRRSHF